MAANPFHLPGVRQGVDIQDAMLFSKPYGGLDWRPIPFATLQVEISLTYKGGQVVVRHGTPFLLHSVRRGLLGKESSRSRISQRVPGGEPGALADVADIAVCIPSQSVPRIQEAHMLIGHLICEMALRMTTGDDQTRFAANAVQA